MKKSLLFISYTFLIANSYSQENKIEATGSVGIGTRNPESKLVVLDNGIGVTIGTGTNISGLGFNRSVNGGKIYNEGISAWQLTARDNLFSLERYISGQTSISPLNILKNGNIGIGTKSPKSKLEVNGDISLARSKKIKFLENVGGEDRAYIRSTNGENGDYNSLIFAIGNGRESMFLKPNGNLGIGTKSPESKFVVMDNNIGVSIGTGSDISGLGFNRSVNGGKIYNSNIHAWQFTARDERFSLEGYNNTSGNSLLNVLKNGNIGIGTKNPKSKLEINGDISLVRSKKIKFLENVGGEDRAYIRSTNGENGDYNSLIFAIGNGQESMFLKPNGNLGIGTNKPDSKLTVAGNIHSREVKVTIDAGADFVFENNYNLPPLNEIEIYVKKHKHLPEIDSAKEMETNGLNLAEMNIKLLRKIEELTLYTIEQEKKITKLEKDNLELKSISDKLLGLEKLIKKN